MLLALAINFLRPQRDSTMSHGGHSLRIQPNALVWCKLKGFSELWAGQIVDPLKATEEALAMKQPGTFLVSFFPDSAFQWVPPDKIFDFEEHLEKYSKGARGKVRHPRARSPHRMQGVICPPARNPCMETWAPACPITAPSSRPGAPSSSW